jgi:hypothetical protein
MYTSSIYSSNSGPITDTVVIKNYLQRRGVTGFNLSGINEPYVNSITITLADENNVALNNNGLNTKGTVENAGIYFNNYNDDTMLNIILADSTVFASIPTDSCYQCNAQSSKINYQGTTIALGKLIYRRRLPVQLLNGGIRIHYITSLMTKSNPISSCSNFFNNEWGYEIIKYQWGFINHLGNGDTLVMQTRILNLAKL